MKNVKYINLGLQDSWEQKLDKQIPTILLASRNYLDKTDHNMFFNSIKNLNLLWLTFIGERADLLEDEFDNLIELESIKCEQLLDVLTTNHSFQTICRNSVEDILHEYLVMSNIGLERCQLISFLDLNSSDDLILYKSIMKNLQ